MKGVSEGPLHREEKNNMPKKVNYIRYRAASVDISPPFPVNMAGYADAEGTHLTSDMPLLYDRAYKKRL